MTRPRPLDHRPTQSDGRVHGAIVGCRRADGRWLLIRRAATVPLAPGKVCFPGGAIEPGEARAAAAAREFAEELGIAPTNLRQIWTHTFPNERNLTLWGFLADLPAEDLRPDPEEVAEVLWLTPEEAANRPDGLPMTGAFIAALEEASEA